MTTAREIVTPRVQCAAMDETLADAARKMRDLDVGALPISDEDNRLKGMITDRDMVICIALGADPNEIRVRELSEGRPVTIGADDSVQEAMRTMSEHGVRRLPVVDGQDLVGIVCREDLARHLPAGDVGVPVQTVAPAPRAG